MAFSSRQPRTGIFTLLATTLISMSGCGGTGQDEGGVADVSQTIRGLALDGHLARAMVFADFDNNGTRDAWEPFAFTDDEGYFSFNPRTQTDYCTVVEYMDFCLRLERAVDEFVIRVDGGYDTLTGEPFAGQMSRRIEQHDLDRLDQAMVTPLTTLISSVRGPELQDIILANAGLGRHDLDVDYLDRDTQSVDYRLFNKALKIHKVMTILADRVQDAYGEIGSAVGTPNDLTANMYTNLARALTKDTALDEVLTDPASLQGLLAETARFAEEVYARRDLALPAHAVGSPPEVFTRGSLQARTLSLIADHLVPGTPDTLASLPGRVRALEMLTIKLLDENLFDTRVDQALDFFHAQRDDSLVEALIGALDHEAADLNSLIGADFASDVFSSGEGIFAAARLPVDALPFQALPGMRLRASDMDLGWAPHDLRDAEVEFYFKGDGAAASGNFDACVKYIDGADSEGRLGDANTRGELVRGHWSLLGAADNNGGSYSLVLTIKYLNATYQAIMKPAGFEMIDGKSQHKVRFDYANEYRTWHSMDGLRPWNSLPQSNTDCEQRLPSRIGL